MSSYVRQVKVFAVFDGQKIEATLRPLLYIDLLALRTADDAASLSVYGGMLPKYVLDMTPILDADSALISLEIIGSEAFFMPLVSELLVAHIAAAQPSNPPQPASPSVAH